MSFQADSGLLPDQHCRNTVTADAIKERARAERFTKVGIVSAASLDEEGRRLKEWLARGYHGTMSWMARDVEKRIDSRGYRGRVGRMQSER